MKQYSLVIRVMQNWSPLHQPTRSAMYVTCHRLLHKFNRYWSAGQCNGYDFKSGTETSNYYSWRIV